MTKENHTYQIISVILLITVISFVGLYFTKSAPSQEINKQTCSDFINECPEIPAEKALMFATLNSWGENTYDSSKNLFSVEIYNFGNVEARNVEVICSVTVGDEDGFEVSDIPVSTATKRIGNVASTSYKFVDLENNVDKRKEGGYPLASCRISYCENCEILAERIPDLK
jgi:hypothetical protein